MSTEYVLTLSCPDRPGVVAAVSGLLAARGCNITESQQFGDRDAQRFFMRVQFAATLPEDELRAAFAALAPEFGMECQLHDLARPAARAHHGQQVRPLPERPALPRRGPERSTSRSSRSSPTTPTCAR